MPKRLLYISLVIFLAWSHSIPAQAGFSGQRYDKWVENILADGVWQPWQAEKDKRYQVFQRDLFISESYLNKGQHALGLSYLKKATFTLQDIHESLARIHSWPPALTSVLPPGEGEAYENSRKARQNHKIHTIHLHLQYEQYYFHSQPLSAEQFLYLEKASGLYNDMKDSELTGKIKGSYLGQYLAALARFKAGKGQGLENIAKDSVPGFKLEENYRNDYWFNKLVKRNIFLAISWGFNKTATRLLNYLEQNKSYDLSAEVKFQVFLALGLVAKAQQAVLSEIFSINLDQAFAWPRYVDFKVKNIHLMLISQQYRQALQQAVALSGEIEGYMKKTLVSLDLEGLFKERQLYLYTLSELLRYDLNLPSEPLQLDLSRWPTQYENTLGRYYAMLAQLERPVTKNNLQQLARPLVLQLEAITGARQKTGNRSKQAIESLAALGEEASRNTASLYQLSLSDNQVEKYWQEAFKAFLLSTRFSPHPGLLPLNEFEADGLEKILKHSANPAILSMLAFSQLWRQVLYTHDLLASSPVNRIRYLALAHNQFFQPIINPKPLYRWYQELPPAEISPLNEECGDGKTICLYLYPQRDATTAFLQGTGITEKLRLNLGNSDINNLSVNFLQSFSPGAELKPRATLENISRQFTPLLKVLGSIKKDRIRIYAYRSATFLPFEALQLSATEKLSDRFLVSRKLQTDYILSKSTPAPLKARWFFLGVGRPGGGFLGLNKAQDELDDIEGVFARKKIFRADKGYAQNLVKALNQAGNTLAHFASSWLPSPDQTAESYLGLGQADQQIALNQLVKAEQLPGIIISRQKMLPFARTKEIYIKKLLHTFYQKKARYLIISTVETPKKFRSAFYYDLYYRVERKQTDFTKAYRASLLRTKKGFAGDLWPYLVTLYEP